MIELLVGTIASGKSTYARNRAKQGWIIVNDDDIVNLVHGGEYLQYDKKLKPLYKSIENLIIAYSVGVGKSVVIDRGLNVSVAGRKRFVALAQSLDTPIYAVVFEPNSPEIHARRRMSDDPRGYSEEYWIGVAKSQIGRFIMPSVEEGFAKVDTF